MEQTSNVVMSMLQTMASQAAGIPKPGKTEGDELSDFQKLLEEKSQEKDPLLEGPSKSETKPQADAPKKDKAPVQKQENSLERIKKLAEQGYLVVQPSIAAVTLDGQVFQPDEYVEIWTPTGVELIPVTDLDEAQMGELQQLLDGLAPTHVIDVSDPEADAMLEATDPTVEHGPAQLLEKAAGLEADQTVQTAVEEVQPQEGEDGGSMMELTAGQQGPQRIFRDVEAAPVKVGEVYDAQESGAPDVAQQIDTQLAQAMGQGESMVRIRLNPEHLGEVTVEISQNADGILHIALSARSGETRSLLERSAGELQGLLGSRTQQTVEVEVQRGQESQQNQQRQQSYDGHNGHAQDGREQERRQRRTQTHGQDFMQQLRLGLIPVDGEG